MKTEVHASCRPYFTTRRMATIALLSAISIVMSIVPGIGFIYVGVIKATFMHIPVIIAAITEGPVAGAIVGLIFGISSLVINMSGPLAPVFINPLVSVAPRIMIGLSAAYTYKALKHVSNCGSKNNSKSGKICAIISVPAAAAVGTIMNTAGVLGMIYVVAAREFTQVKGVTMANLGHILAGVALTNGVAELVVAVVLVTAIIKGINTIRK